MRSAINLRPLVITRWPGLSALLLTAALGVAACGSTPGTPAPHHSPTSHVTPSPSSSGTGVKVETATVTGYGTVLVDSQGRSLYILTSETGGTLTCTVANGCTSFWIELDLPSGTTAATAGAGVHSSMLGTEPGSSGTVVTYNGYPLYTFSGDSGAHQSHGEGLKSFGGTWYLMQASGTLAKASTASTTPSSGGGGYGY